MLEVEAPRDGLLDRIRGEYLEMPGLRLTVPQAARLSGIEPLPCLALLTALVEKGFLAQTPKGCYARRDQLSPRGE